MSKSNKDKTIDELLAEQFGGGTKVEDLAAKPTPPASPKNSDDQLRADLLREVTAAIDRVLSKRRGTPPSGDGLDLDLTGLG